MKRLLLAAAFGLATTTVAIAEPVTYAFDKTHTVIRGSWDHQGFSTMSIEMTDYEGSLVLDVETPSNSTVDITFNLIDGFWVGANQDRFIAHLNSPDLFNTAENPTAHFVGTEFVSETDTTGIMTGDLTMNGQTHPVSLNVTLNRSNTNDDGVTKLGFTATGTLTRSQWGLGFAAPWVSDEIELFISTEVVSQ